MKKDSHPLACQHSGRWHLFLRSVNLINKLGTSLGHKTNIPILGSKQRLNLQGQHESLAGKGGPSTNSCSGACSCLFLKGGKDTGKARGCRRLPQSQCDAASGAAAAPWPPSFLRTERPWPRTVHVTRCGDTTNPREMGTPNECCAPQSNPPLLIFPKPLSQFAH